MIVTIEITNQLEDEVSLNEDQLLLVCSGLVDQHNDRGDFEGRLIFVGATLLSLPGSMSCPASSCPSTSVQGIV